MTTFLYLVFFSSLGIGKYPGDDALQSGCRSHPLKGGGRQNNIERPILTKHLCADFNESHSIAHKALALLLFSSTYTLLKLNFVQTMEAMFEALDALIKIRVCFLRFLTYSLVCTKASSH